MTTTKDAPGSPAVQDTGRWTARNLAVLAVLTLLTELVALGYNLVTPGLNPMAAEFRTTQIGWIITIYTIVGSIVTPLFGKLGDLYGKRRVLLGAVLLTAAGSLVVAVAPSIGIAIAGRALQGAGLAIVPLTYSLMRDVFPSRLVPLAVSVAMTGLGIVTVIGPFIAGYLVDEHGFRSIYWVLFGLPLVLGALAMAVVPESDVRLRARLDWPGAFLLAASVGLLLLAVSMGNTWGWASARTLGCVAGGILALAAWYVLERRTAEPLVKPSLLAGRPVLTTLLAGAFTQASIAVASTLLTMMVMTPRALGHDYGFGDTALGVTRYTVLAGVFTVAGGIVLGYLAGRTGTRAPLAFGAAALAIGCLSLALAHTERWQVIAGYAVVGIGGGFCYAAIPNLVIAAVPPEEQGVGAGAVSMLQSLGASAGVQAVFAVLTLHVATTVQGQPIYSGGGFTTGLVVAAVFALLGTAAAVALPHGRRPARTTG